MVLIIKLPISQYIARSFEAILKQNIIAIFLIYIRYEKIPWFHGITGILPITRECICMALKSKTFDKLIVGFVYTTYTGIYLCIPVYTGVWCIPVRVYTIVYLYTCVYLCIPVYTCVYPCLPLYIVVYLCIPVTLYMCIPVHVYTGVYPVYTSVYTCVYLCGV